MSVIMDNRLSDDPEAEVKKLQALVRELELQNQELRSEREQLKEAGSPRKQQGVTEETEKQQEGARKQEEEEDKHEKILEETELLGMTEEEKHADDETWLFDSPKTKSASDEWLRKDVDDPSLLVVKKSLIQKLDQIALSPQHSPRHSFSPCSSSGVLSPDSPPSSRGEIDTRTFVRPKKKRSLAFGDAANDENRNSLLRRDGSSRECLARSSGSLGSEDDDRLSSASEGSFSYQLTDVADVNALARLQEESLKLPDPRRGSRLPGIRAGSSSGSVGRPYASAGSGGSATSSQEDLLSGPHPSGSPLRQPRTLQPPRRYYSQANTPSREGSDLSTPPDSPYNSQHNLELCNGRSSRVPSGLTRGFGSDPRLLDSTPSSSRGASPARSYESPNASQIDVRAGPKTSRLQAPQMRSRLNAPSPARIPMPSGLPQASELPRPKTTAIPRPGSRLQPPKARSGLVQPRYSAQEDWRDGCF